MLFCAGAGIAKSSARIYRISLTTWGWMFAGEPASTGPARRGANPPIFPVAAIDKPALPGLLAELAATRADEMDAETVNRELSIARKAIGWWQRQGWIEGDPTIGIERRPAPPDRTRALAESQIAALWRLDVARDAVEDALRVRGPGRRGAVPERGRPVPAGQARKDHRQGRGDGVDPLAVWHRPAAAPAYRRPHPRASVPHRPQGPGRHAVARRVQETGRARLSYPRSTSTRTWSRRAPRKQKHTVERIQKRLAEEHDFDLASYSTLRNYVRKRRPEIVAEDREGRQYLEGMVPQAHLPGEEAAVDFADVWVRVAGEVVKCHLFTLRLSYSGKAVHRVFASQAQKSFWLRE
ncbi:hypothetical protein ACF08M_38265 [Streptomyces sp. NPDC015032]|uniref:hypothetical protein n=1 Tax=Streptomyces sp. NPDC015032 TaxID=3364937 RepID=UPI0036F70DD9